MYYIHPLNIWVLNVLGIGESSGKPGSQGPHFHNAYFQMGQAIPKKIPNMNHGENK